MIVCVCHKNNFLIRHLDLNIRDHLPLKQLNRVVIYISHFAEYNHYTVKPKIKDHVEKKGRQQQHKREQKACVHVYTPGWSPQASTNQPPQWSVQWSEAS